MPVRLPRFSRVFQVLTTVLVLAAAWPGGGGDAAFAQSTGPQSTAAPSAGRQSGPARPSSVAFHYGADAPLAQLRLFDVVVVEPGHGFDPAAHRRRSADRSELYAYVSIGELDTGRPYAKALERVVRAERNPDWGGVLIDQAHPDWPTLLVEQLVRPLVDRGYRGLFLDTLDSYQLFAKDEASRAAQQEGMTRAIGEIKRRFPSLRLILNRGFEMLPTIAPQVEMVAAESLFGRWNARDKRYEDVPAEDRQWLGDRLREARDRYGLATISIDYASPGDRARQRALARTILAAGSIPWVADGGLRTVGVGAIEVMPRTVLLLHDESAETGDEHYSDAQRQLAMPLHYLGYRTELLDITRRALPTGSLADRYAAVVAIFRDADVGLKSNLAGLITRALDEKVPMVFFNSLGTPLDDKLAARMGLSQATATLGTPLSIRHIERPVVGFEIDPTPNRFEGLRLVARPGQALLTIADPKGTTYDGVAVTDWGGFVVYPFGVVTLQPGNTERWVTDPIAFLRRALPVPPWPLPDPTTEAGRRLLLIHIDGDGFPSRAEVPGSPFASEVMLREFIARYPVPHTVSVIQGETAANGLYPQFSAALEEIARRIYQLPHVESASHSYSHPFDWYAVRSKTDKPYNLPIPNYKFDVAAEIEGSIGYIESQLSPPGKKAGVFLWTGACVPPPETLARAWRAGLLNMNGGDTTITRANASLTQVSALSLRKDGWLQIYAPNQNENVYTNNWTGPFYGFERVIETFELTERPRRLKPINIYYHTYAASKPASINALRKVYDWALAQPVHPVYSSEYIRKVVDFDDMAVGGMLAPAATDGPSWTGWRIAGDGDLRNLRWSAAERARIDWAASEELAGFRTGVDGDYLHLSSARSTVRFVGGTRDASKEPPLLVDANGRVSSWRRDAAQTTFRFRAHVPGQLRLSHAQGCIVRADGRTLTPKAVPAAERTVKSAANGEYLYQFPQASGGDGILVSVGCG